MSQESKTSHLVELVRSGFEAAKDRDLDAMLTPFASDAVWEAAPLGVSFEGLAAIRGFFEDWMDAYEEFEMEPEEVLDFGSGVVFSVVLQQGRPAASSCVVQVRSGFVALFSGGTIVRVTSHTDIDEARAAAERLAKERE